MALEKLKDLLKNETDNLGFAEALFGVCGAVFLYLVDLTTKWNGYPLLEVFSGALLIDALRIVIFGFLQLSHTLRDRIHADIESQMDHLDNVRKKLPRVARVFDSKEKNRRPQH